MYAIRSYYVYVTDKYVSTSTHFQLSEWQLFGTEVTTTGMNTLSATVNIYPNPAKEEVFIQVEEKSNVYVYDMLGQIKYSGILEKGTNKVDVSDYNKAMYVVKVSTEKSSNSFILRKE